MNLGSYKFIRYRDYLCLVKLFKDDTLLEVYLNPRTFKYTESEINQSYFYLNVSNITLPTIKNIRKDYQWGDLIYFVAGNQFIKGKIIRKDKNIYIVSDVYNIYRYRTADQLIPYNWHILHINCRKAIEAWLYCSRRYLYLDLRKLISKYIWELRNEYEWDFS